MLESTAERTSVNTQDPQSTILSVNMSSVTKLTHLNTDCQSLLAAISSKTPPADLYGIIQDIDQLSLCFTSVSFNFVARLSNSAADQLAKFALCNATSSISPSGA